MKYGAIFLIKIVNGTIRETLWWDDEVDRDNEIYCFEAEMNESNAKILHIQDLSVACDSIIAIKKIKNTKKTKKIKMGV
ncbi:MAG: hypothetical protein IKC93_01400 [Candidatus Methanomethylophilaceae archaeon]|nr:hypothetical protein [Candidatus Methanomethylophilaceae archaeon]